jgi:hypothetical protein
MDDLKLTATDLLRDLVKYVESDGFTDSHTDVVNWLVDFADEARGVLKEADDEEGAD